MKRATKMARDCCDCGVIVASGDLRCRRCAELRKRRAEIRDLKARLKACREAWFDPAGDGADDGRIDRATDMRRKDWREP